MHLSDLTRFVAGNRHLLEQLRDAMLAIEAVVDENRTAIYSSAIPIIGGASIGAHVRHILDFYSAFYLGLKKGKINYDDRTRNSNIENKLGSGLIQLHATVEQLEIVSNLSNRPVEIFASIDVNETVNYKMSCLSRELQTLHSHTTHHMAIIAIILKLNDIDVDCHFGKAPSTIQYENELSYQQASGDSSKLTN